MRIRLHVVVHGNENIAENLKLKLSQLQNKLSYSPSRECPALIDCFEFYCSADLNIEEITELKSKLNNDWEGEENDCNAYGFNTKMYDPDMYYVQLEY